MKNAYIFPGQGAQFPGMAKELYEREPIARELFARAEEILGFRITEVLFHGTAEELKATRVAQPAIFLHSVILAECYRALPEQEAAKRGLEPYSPAMVAGHSLGEFSALTVAGAMDFDDALRLVALRAEEMQKCCERVPGGMAAIIGMDSAAVEKICAACGGTVLAANYNSDGQTVISGEREAVAEACRLAGAQGARRTLPLAVGGAFHSPLMAPAGLALGKAINETEIRVPAVPVYQNVTAAAETDPARIRENLLAQLTSPVRWTQTVRAMMADGAGGFLEIGPGNVLQGLVRRIADPSVRTGGLATL